MATTGSAVQELRLLFTPAENGSFTVRLEDAPGNAVGVAATLTPFLSNSDFENLRWYLEEYMDLPDGGAIVPGRRGRKAARRMGRTAARRRLRRAGECRLLRKLLAAPEPRELTIATDRSVLLRPPWELMRDQAGSLAQRIAMHANSRRRNPLWRVKSSYLCGCFTSSVDRTTRDSSIRATRRGPS